MSRFENTLGFAVWVGPSTVHPPYEKLHIPPFSRQPSSEAPSPRTPTHKPVILPVSSPHGRLTTAMIAVPFFSPAQTTAPAAPALYSAVVPSPFARQLGSVFYIPAATGLQLRVTTRRCFDLARQLASWDYSCVIHCPTDEFLLTVGRYYMQALSAIQAGQSRSKSSLNGFNANETQLQAYLPINHVFRIQHKTTER
ncbi:hypothetical protein C8J57DRAFT_1478233 [Mycena rebaudengoi]|nr:hypothetical protein C8J57DRAFT_1478233 [Mycena rebaudengoi]